MGFLDEIKNKMHLGGQQGYCLLYTSDAADEEDV